MDKWIKCEDCPFGGQYILKDYEDLGNVIVTTKFVKENKELYVYKSIKDQSFLFLVKDRNEWKPLTYIPEEVIDSMIGRIIFDGKTF